MIATSALTLVAALIMAAAITTRTPRPATLAATTPVVHVGADEHWRPALEVGAVEQPAVIADAGLDLDARTILADFDDLIDSWRTDPPWLTEWRATVDDAYAGAALDTELHHRWRWGALDVPTGEYAIIVPSDGVR